MATPLNHKKTAAIISIVIGVLLSPFLFGWLKVMTTPGDGWVFLGTVLFYTIPAFLSPIFLILGIRFLARSNNPSISKPKTKVVSKHAKLNLSIAIGIAVLAAGLIIALVVLSIAPTVMEYGSFGLALSIIPVGFLVLCVILFVMASLSIRKYSRELNR